MKLAFVLGTRPEIIKLSPLIRAATGAGTPLVVIHTGQHYSPEMDARFFAELALAQPQQNLGIGSLAPAAQVGRMIERLGEVLAAERPDWVVVQGDTNSTLAGALAADKLGIPVAHVEAGLRSFDRRMQEEKNRIQVDHLADALFCPTELQRDLLRRENLPMEACHVVGNTIVDVVAGLRPTAAAAAQCLGRFELRRKEFVYLTLHREENVDDPALLRGLLDGVHRAAAAQGLRVLFPVHPRTARQMQAHGVGLPGSFSAVAPVGLAESLALQEQARVVVTDSGGVQEEACILGTPCVTLRTSTERPETIDCGANLLAGVRPEGAERGIGQVLAGSRTWQHPYGDGTSASRILAVLAKGPRRRQEAERPAAPAAAPGAVLLPSDGDWTGREMGDHEILMAARAIRSGTLNSTKGTFVARFEKEFAKRYGVKHAIACASGSAAFHCALAALKLKGGDEVITTPITDMGALTPILYEGCVPIFADVDPWTLNVTAETIAARIGERTKAIVVTHLFGLPVDMAPVRALARSKGIPVIEDVAQAFYAEDRIGRVGTLSEIASFSLQQGKHMTTGEGGIVLTNDDTLARNVFLFVNKAWGYGDPKPDHYFPALNYRLTELQGAVALAQLDKVEWVVQRRRDVAAAITAGLQGVPGLTLPQVPAGVKHSWWKYALMVDPAVVPGGAVELGKKMKERGVFCVPRYIQKPAFECQLFHDWNASPVSALPLRGADGRIRPQPVFQRKDYPGTTQALDRVIVLPINELYTQEHVDFVTRVIREEAARLTPAKAVVR